MRAKHVWWFNSIRGCADDPSWQSGKKRKYDTNVLINLFSRMHSLWQIVWSMGEGKLSERVGEKKSWTLKILIPLWIYLLSTFISKALRHNKALPISHLNSQHYLALGCITLTKYHSAWDETQRGTFVFGSEWNLKGIMALGRYSHNPTQGLCM